MLLNETMMLYEEPGWIGVFTRDELLGAFRNGTRVRKLYNAPNDELPAGIEGTVLGSIKYANTVKYFVELDRMPRVAICMDAMRLEVLLVKENNDG